MNVGMRIKQLLTFDFCLHSDIQFINKLPLCPVFGKGTNCHRLNEIKPALALVKFLLFRSGKMPVLSSD